MINNVKIMDLYVDENLMFDKDDQMEQELKDFKEQIKDIDLNNINEFDVWFSVYKILNYDIFKDLKLEGVYKFNNSSAVVEITFHERKEYDLLYYTQEDKTVTVYNIKVENELNAVKKEVIRRLLVPNTTDEALAYASRRINTDEIKEISILLDNLSQKEKVEINLNKETAHEKFMNMYKKNPNNAEILLRLGMSKEIKDENVRKTFIEQMLSKLK